MANLFNLLTGIKDKVQNRGLFGKLTSQQEPLPAIQLDDYGNKDYQKSLDLAQNTTPMSMKDRLLGRTMTMDKQTINPDGTTELETISNYKPGLLNDIAGGFKENRNTPMSLENYGQNELADGRKKGFAYRVGEGLGSLARFGESPLGRGLIVGGLVGATGGSGLEALAYGAGTGALNQGLRTQDRMYRDDLIRSYQQSINNNPALTDEEKLQQIQDAENSVNSLRGYVNSNTYGNLLRAQQLRDNAAYRKMYYDNQQEQNRLNNQLRQDQLAYQKAQDRANNAYRYAQLDTQRRGQDLNYQAAQDRLKADENKQTNDKAMEKAQALAEVKTQLDSFTNTFKDMPNKLESNTLGRLRNATGFQTQDEANFNSQRTLLFNVIARQLGGEKGVLSDQDIKRIEAALPNLTDSYDQKMAKMRAVYNLLDIRTGAKTSSNNDEGWAF